MHFNFCAVAVKFRSRKITRYWTLENRRENCNWRLSWWNHFLLCPVCIFFTLDKNLHESSHPIPLVVSLVSDEGPPEWQTRVTHIVSIFPGSFFCSVIIQPHSSLCWPKASLQVTALSSGGDEILRPPLATPLISSLIILGIMVDQLR